DKDLAQLVNEHVELVNTMNSERQDIEGVKKKFGVAPEQIIDYLMLTGDAADNIPGVPKVGPKTAAKWPAEYGRIEKLIENAHAIKGVVGENLRASIPNFELTRKLITVKTDCDLGEFGIGMEALIPRTPDTERLIELYDAYGFRTWLRELTGEQDRLPAQDSRVVVEAVPAAPSDTPVHYETILDWEALGRWLDTLMSAELVAVDTETTSLDPMLARLVGISLSVAPGAAC